MSNTVEEVLTKNGIAYQRSGRRFLIKCLNPEHPDRNPSLSLDSITGLGKCFSCGFKVNLFTHFGAAYNFQSVKVSLLQNKLDALKASLIGMDMPEGFVPETREFRGISNKTIRKFDGFLLPNVDEFKDRLVFPLRDSTGKIRCLIGRHKYSDANPKYIVKPPKADIPFFPPTIKPYKGAIFLVEGIFDALNLIDKGVENVVCVFGTQSITERSKYKFVPLQLMGVSKIYILFDGDAAGKKASEQLTPIIKNMGFEVDTIDLPDGTDPGDLEAEDVKQLLECIR